MYFFFVSILDYISPNKGILFSKLTKKCKGEQSWLFFVKGHFCLWAFMSVYMLRMETICSAKKENSVFKS